MRTRVMLVDDHRMVRDAVVVLVSHEPDLVVVGVAGDARSAVREARTTRPEVVVMDLDLAGTDGLAATRSLLALDPTLRVLVLSASCTPSLIDAAVDAGACGYLVKGDRAQLLLDGIRLAAAGGHPMARQVATVRTTWPEPAGPAAPRTPPSARWSWWFRRRRTWCTAPALLVVLALLLTVPSPALAHSDLVGSTPRDGDTVSLRTDRLVLVFGDDLLPGSEQVVVRDAAGEDVVAGTPSVTGGTLEVPLDLSAPGPHLVTYRVLSGDGHAVVGELSFDVVGTGAPAVAVTPAVAEASGGPLGSPIWWLAGAVGAVGAVALLRRGLAPPRR